MNVYDVEQGKAMSQAEVGRKENEITKASAALKLVKITGKVFTSDAIHAYPKTAVDTNCGRKRRLYISSQRKSGKVVQKYLNTVCTEVTQTWLWKNRNQFPDRLESKQRPWSHRTPHHPRQ